MSKYLLPHMPVLPLDKSQLTPAPRDANISALHSLQMGLYSYVSIRTAHPGCLNSSVSIQISWELEAVLVDES